MFASSNLWMMQITRTVTLKKITIKTPWVSHHSNITCPILKIKVCPMKTQRWCLARCQLSLSKLRIHRQSLRLLHLFFSFFLTSRSWQKTVELPGLSPAMGAEESNSEMVHWKMFPPGNQIITESLKHFSDLNEYCVAELLREH